MVGAVTIGDAAFIMATKGFIPGRERSESIGGQELTSAYIYYFSRLL
jgi:hypothetical protein